MLESTLILIGIIVVVLPLIVGYLMMMGLLAVAAFEGILALIDKVFDESKIRRQHSGHLSRRLKEKFLTTQDVEQGEIWPAHDQEEKPEEAIYPQAS